MFKYELIIFKLVTYASLLVNYAQNFIFLSKCSLNKCNNLSELMQTGESECNFMYITQFLHMFQVDIHYNLDKFPHYS